MVRGLNNSQWQSISLLLSLVSGCGGGSARPTNPGDNDPPPPNASKVPVGTYPVMDLVGEVQCWMGETIADLDSGHATATRTLSRRGWDAATSTVHEESAVWVGPIMNALPDYPPPQHSTSEYKLEGSSANFTSRWESAVEDAQCKRLKTCKGVQSGTLSGTATFVGEPGHWTAWNVEIDVGGGTMLKVDNTVGEDKSVTFTGGLFDTTGKQIVVVNGKLNALEPQACKDEFSKVAPFSKK
jgi:hypothetical protein